MLRWARARCGGGLALEVALALDEAAERHDERVARAREAAAADGGYPAAAAAFRVLLDGIRSGLVEPAAIARIAAEARAYHDAARAADPARAAELRLERAQLELADRRPADALALLEAGADPAGDPADGPADALRRHAAYAARRFDLALGAAPERLALAG